MIIQDRANAIELTLLERLPDDLPTPGDVRLRVKVEAEGFAGLSEVWIEKATLERFTRDLLALERTRDGEAVLKSVSPDAFVLRLRSVDRAGHIAVSGQLGRITYGLKAYEQRLHYAFDLSSDMLGTWVEAFRTEIATQTTT